MQFSSTLRPGSRTLFLLFALLACCSSGCLCAFHRDWQEAKSCPPVDNLAGLWEGTWVSHTNGHHGKLRAIITNCGNGRYRAQYQGTFHVVIPFVYETTHCRTSSDGGVVHFTGREELCQLAGGTYRMNGWANGQRFVANYKSDNDCGVFKMQRVGSCGCCATGCCATEACGVMPDDCQ